MSRRSGPRIERTGPGSGSPPSEEDPTEDPEEDLPEELQNEDTRDTSIGDITQEADAERFDRTYLAEKEDFQIGGELNSPAPFPLQVLPRMAYTINYNVVYDAEKERWVPQKKSDALAGAVVASGAITVSPSGSQVDDAGVSVSEVDGDPLLLAYGYDSAPNAALEFAQIDDDDQTASSISVQLEGGQTGGTYGVRVTNEESETVTVSYALVRVRIS